MDVRGGGQYIEGLSWRNREAGSLSSSVAAFRATVCTIAAMSPLTSVPIVVLAALQAAVSFSTVARGTDSQIDEPRQAIVQSADAWRALWMEHAGGAPPVAPDFTRETIVSVFLGTRPTAGFDVEITAVLQQGMETVVEYAERRPGRDAVTAQVLTAPFHIVRIPRPPGRIVFRSRE